jgi:hypothetical protein
MPKDVNLFKNHQLPLARIKKIMKSDEDVRVHLNLPRWFHRKHLSSLRRLARLLSSSSPTELGLLLSNQKEERCKYYIIDLEKWCICVHLQYLNFRFPHRHHPKLRSKSTEKVSSRRNVPNFANEQRSPPKMKTWLNAIYS